MPRPPPVFRLVRRSLGEGGSRRSAFSRITVPGSARYNVRDGRYLRGGDAPDGTSALSPCGPPKGWPQLFRSRRSAFSQARYFEDGTGDLPEIIRSCISPFRFIPFPTFAYPCGEQSLQKKRDILRSAPTGGVRLLSDSSELSDRSNRLNGRSCPPKTDEGPPQKLTMLCSGPVLCLDVRHYLDR